jgi:hypothetical protein
MDSQIVIYDCASWLRSKGVEERKGGTVIDVDERLHHWDRYELHFKNAASSAFDAVMFLFVTQ